MYKVEFVCNITSLYQSKEVIRRVILKYVELSS